MTGSTTRSRASDHQTPAASARQQTRSGANVRRQSPFGKCAPSAGGWRPFLPALAADSAPGPTDRAPSAAAQETPAVSDRWDVAGLQPAIARVTAQDRRRESFLLLRS